MFLFDFFTCHKAEVLILILEIQHKNKKLLLVLPWAKRTPYDRYAPSPAQNRNISKIYIFLQ